MPFDACPETSASARAPDASLSTAHPLDPLSQLALRARSGDARALHQLLAKLPPRLTPWVKVELQRRGQSVDAHQLDDIVQDLVIATWRADLARFDPQKGSLLGFLRKRVAWRVGDTLRQTTRRSHISLDQMREQGREPAAHAACPESRLESLRAELSLRLLPRLVDGALADLADPAAAVAVRVHDLRACPLREVAQQLKVHTSNACRARQRGLRYLAERLPALLPVAA